MRPTSRNRVPRKSQAQPRHVAAATPKTAVPRSGGRSCNDAPEQLQSTCWRALGKAFFKLGSWEKAGQALSRVLELSPRDARAHHDLGKVFYNLGREEEAVASYRRALESNPRLVQAHNSLGALLADLGRLAEAADSFRQALAINPDSGFALHCLGSMMDRVGGMDGQAVDYLERSILLDPGNAAAITTLGNLLLRTGQPDRSLAMFRRAQQLSPLITWRARKEQADFSALFLYAPGTGCTPVDYLARRAPFDCHFYCVLPEAPAHLAMLQARADVVVNTIGDADYGREILPFAQDLVERLGRPVVNHPGLVRNTDRESVARQLAGIPHCAIPRTVRLAGPVLAKAIADRSLGGFTLPLLVRLAGNHGGDDFERFSELEEIARFVARRPGADYYLTQYLDYRSADGYYRKYRLISVAGELFPYHLAIHDDWKVHHFRTDMANQGWMRAEEEAFLRDPRLVFPGERMKALGGVACAMGLDFCGIDCALDSHGRIVVFETNATMLVHDEKEGIFAYKNPYISRIKDAFEALLARLARGAAQTRPVGLAAKRRHD